MFSRLKIACAVVFAVFAFTAVSAAQDSLPSPTGPVVLTITGEVAASNAPDGAAFDMEMLKALPSRSFTTTTIWTQGPQEFVGVSLDVFLTHVGIAEGTLLAKAINDYEVPLPVSDAIPTGPMIAYLRNGEPMATRDKGPLWIVYPYDSEPEYAAEKYYSRSIWQLVQITATN